MVMVSILMGMGMGMATVLTQKTLITLQILKINYEY